MNVIKDFEEEKAKTEAVFRHFSRLLKISFMKVQSKLLNIINNLKHFLLTSEY